MNNTNNTENHILELRHVTKIYKDNGNGNDNGNGDIEVINDINLVIDKGEFITLLGAPGAGKSTLFRMISGLDVPSQGMIFHHGEELKGINPHVGVVFQSATLFPWMTAEENIDIALKTKKPDLSKEERNKIIDRLLSLVNLKSKENLYPRQLSGIEKTNIDLIRGLVIEPEILVLDEPFTSLDMISAEILSNEMLKLWQDKKTKTQSVLMITSDIEEAIIMSTRIVILKKQSNGDNNNNNNNRPGIIVSDIKVDLPYPRQLTDPQFQILYNKIHSILT